MLEGKTLVCNHPERPDAPAPIVKWTAGCKQHEPVQTPAGGAK